MAHRTMMTRLSRTAIVAGLLALPFSPVVSLESDTQEEPQLAFADSFDDFETLPEVAQPAGNVVDITEITPPVEIAPEPKPEPKPAPARDIRSIGSGVASYYGKRFHGRLTANGERFNMNAMTAAHKTLPFGTKVRVTNKRNGKSVVVRINDRGPFIKGRHIDLSRGAATRIGLIATGHARVKLDIVD